MINNCIIAISGDHGAGEIWTHRQSCGRLPEHNDMALFYAIYGPDGFDGPDGR